MKIKSITFEFSPEKNLKETVSRDFWPFLSKNSSWAPYEHWRGKNGSAKFLFSPRYSQKMCISVVNNYADTVSAYSMTSRTLCQRSPRLQGHCVSIVNNYVDTCQHCQRLCGHRVRATTWTSRKLFYFWKSKKLMKKVKKHVIWYFWKLMTTRTPRQRSRWLQWHRVRVVKDYEQDYADTLKAAHRFQSNNHVKKGTWVCLQTH